MNNKHLGQDFDEFLARQGELAQTTAVALKRVIAWQISEQMRIQQVNKTDLAKKMQTSRSAVNRLLDESDSSLTLATLASAALALGAKVDIDISRKQRSS